MAQSKCLGRRCGLKKLTDKSAIAKGFWYKKTNNVKILIIEDESSVISFLEVLLAKERYEFMIARNGEEGLKLFRSFVPDFVLTDINLPGMNGIELLERIRIERPETIVVMLTAFSNEEYVMQAMRLGANNYLKKPILRDHLIGVFRKYQNVIENRSYTTKIAPFIKKQTFDYSFGTSVSVVPEVVNQLIEEINGVFPIDVQVDLKLGLHELIINAVEHGNLGITYFEKSVAVMSDSLTKLYDERLAKPELSSRNVTIKFAQEPNYCEWVIKDEGAGFCPEDIPSPLGEDGILRLHGRGIFICKFQFSEMEYLGNGNTVRVRKYLSEAV